MKAVMRRVRANLRTRQYVVAAIVVVAAFGIAVSGSWVFRSSPSARPNASLWQLVLSDRWTLGFVRISVLLLALYAIASIAALVAGGRWIKGFGTGGLSTDDAVETDRWMAETEHELDRALRFYDLVSEIESRRSDE